MKELRYALKSWLGGMFFFKGQTKIVYSEPNISGHGLEVQIQVILNNGFHCGSDYIYFHFQEIKMKSQMNVLTKYVRWEGEVEDLELS